MSSRDLNLLHPSLKPVAVDFLRLAKEQNLNLVICCTYRDSDVQNALYAQGRLFKGKIVTNARGGESAHNFTIGKVPASLAFDIAVFEDGKYASDKFKGWKIAGKIGESLGLEWLGNPSSKFFELAHFQMKNWKSYK
jgi:peptidoglycan L-alanyl-D-glutamate endopeptidase CwlK